MEAAKQAVQEAEAKRAAERGSGSADEEDPIKTGAMHCRPHSNCPLHPASDLQLT